MPELSDPAKKTNPKNGEKAKEDSGPSGTAPAGPRRSSRRRSVLSSYLEGGITKGTDCTRRGGVTRNHTRSEDLEKVKNVEKKQKSKNTISVADLSPIIQDPPFTPEPSDDTMDDRILENQDLSPRSKKMADKMKDLKVNVERVSSDSFTSESSQKPKKVRAIKFQRFFRNTFLIHIKSSIRDDTLNGVY